MKSVSIIAAAAVMLASSVNAASNDPRECEGKFDLKCILQADLELNAIEIVAHHIQILTHAADLNKPKLSITQQ